MPVEQKKKTRQQAIDMFEGEFIRQQEREREAHRSVMDGLVIPLIDAGLVDDVDISEKA